MLGFVGCTVKNACDKGLQNAEEEEEEEGEGELSGAG